MYHLSHPIGNKQSRIVRAWLSTCQHFSLLQFLAKVVASAAVVAVVVVLIALDRDRRRENPNSKNNEKRERGIHSKIEMTKNLKSIIWHGMGKCVFSASIRQTRNRKKCCSISNSTQDQNRGILATARNGGHRPMAGTVRFRTFFQNIHSN